MEPNITLSGARLLQNLVFSPSRQVEKGSDFIRFNYFQVVLIQVSSLEAIVFLYAHLPKVVLFKLVIAVDSPSEQNAVFGKIRSP